MFANQEKIRFLLSRSLFLGTLLSMLLASPAVAENGNIVRRAAMDIGSAVIKCTVADVNTTTDMIVKVVDEYSEKVDFAEDIARSYDDNFSKEILAAGKAAIVEIKQKAAKRGATVFSAVGGETFAKARNGLAFLKTLAKETGIKTRIVSKQQAALLTYHAVSLHKAVKDTSFLVWDIGGDSMEMTLRNKDRSLRFHVDYMASVSFKNIIIKAIQHKDIDTTHSPNPISQAETENALLYAQNYAEAHVAHDITNRIHEGDLTIVGIGGVHYYAIPALTGTEGEPYTRTDVQNAVKRWTGLPDEAFDSEYADTRFSNLILVLGYMNALGIDQVTPLKVNRADGLLLAPEFW